MDIPVTLLKLTGLFIFEAVIIVFVKIFHYKFRIPSIKPVCETDIPEYIMTFLYKNSKKLERLKFTFSHFIRSEGLLSTPDTGNWGIVLVNKNQSTFAVIKLTDLIYEINTFSVEFVTHFLGGKSLLTINDYKYFFVGSLPDTILNDANSITIEQQWYSHINQLDKIRNNVLPVLPDNEVLSFLENKKAGEYIESLLSSNQIKIAGDNQYCLLIMPAIKYTFKVIIGLFKHILLQKKKSRLPDEFTSIPDEILIEQYKKSQQKINNSKKLNNKMIFLLIINFFLISFAGVLFSVNIIFIGITVILFYELGRYIGNILI